MSSQLHGNAPLGASDALRLARSSGRTAIPSSRGRRARLSQAVADQLLGELILRAHADFDALPADSALRERINQSWPALSDLVSRRRQVKYARAWIHRNGPEEVRPLSQARLERLVGALWWGGAFLAWAGADRIAIVGDRRHHGALLDRAARHAGQLLNFDLYVAFGEEA